MEIRSATENDFGCLLEIWESSVRATHFFLTEDDIAYYRKKIGEEYFFQVQLYVALGGPGLIEAFMGLAPADEGLSVEMLFVRADSRGRGLGRALIERAVALSGGKLELAVNEQNPEARRFYEKMGFKLIGREEVDGEGRPFPLLKMRFEG